TSSKLPDKGPGRGANGNFVLTEFTAEEVGTPNRPIQIAKATATFEQEKFPAAATIDGISKERNNGWAIKGRTGQDHFIVFECAKPLAADAERTILFTLRHDRGENHALGKFRLSATTSPRPAETIQDQKNLPPEIIAILKTETA